MPGWVVIIVINEVFLFVQQVTANFVLPWVYGIQLFSFSDSMGLVNLVPGTMVLKWWAIAKDLCFHPYKRLLWTSEEMMKTEAQNSGGAPSCLKWPWPPTICLTVCTVLIDSSSIITESLLLLGGEKKNVVGLDPNILSLDKPKQKSSSFFLLIMNR